MALQKALRKVLSKAVLSTPVPSKAVLSKEVVRKAVGRAVRRTVLRRTVLSRRAVIGRVVLRRIDGVLLFGGGSSACAEVPTDLFHNSVSVFFLCGFSFSLVLFFVFFETPRLRSQKIQLDDLVKSRWRMV